jgi:virulence factor Mce-like protein
MSPVTPRTRKLLGVAVVVALLVVAVGGYAAYQRRGTGHYTITAHFPRAVSVFRSSDVRVLGLPAGTVTDVEVEGEQVKVTLSVRDDIPVPTDVKAQIVPQSLIGERYIELSPAWKDGEPRAKDHTDIPVERTITPVEPDEALASVKHFLDSLDPKGLGQLVSNLEDDLQGNGKAFNDMLGNLSDVVATFASKDQALGRIIDSFDKLTSALATRETQLGQVLDAFSTASQVLADERQSIEDLVGGLADVSRDGLKLVGDHTTDLRADIQTLTDAAATIEANLTSVDKLLDSGPLLANGLIGAFDAPSRSINLRNNFSPLIPELIDLLLGQLGVPSLCLPVLATCGPAEGQSAAGATPAKLSTASPIGAALELLGAPTLPAPDGGPGFWGDVGHRIRHASDTLLGVGS